MSQEEKPARPELPDDRAAEGASHDSPGPRAAGRSRDAGRPKGQAGTEEARAVGVMAAEAAAGERPDDQPAETRPRSRKGKGKATLDLESESVEALQADSVSAHRSAIGRAEARTVTVRQGAIGGLRADQLSLTQGLVGGVIADRVDVEVGTLGAVVTRDASVRQALVRTMIAGGDVSMEQSLANAVIGRRVLMGESSGALVVLALRVEGNVRSLLDWRGGLIAGVIVGLVLAALGRGRGRRGS